MIAERRLAGVVNTAPAIAYEILIFSGLLIENNADDVFHHQQVGRRHPHAVAHHSLNG
jgi:hypothetical protein